MAKRNEALSTDQALAVITEELIGSHARCPIPYMLSASPAAVPDADKANSGVCVVIDSEIHGRIATAAALTMAEAYRDLATRLLGDRKQRWAREKRGRKPAVGR